MTEVGGRNNGGISVVKEYYVYIISNVSRTLYIGVTSNLQARMHNPSAEGKRWILSNV